MNKAIITGATGLIGLSVAKHFTSLGIDVLCLGRKKLSQSDVDIYFGSPATYLMLSMEDILCLGQRMMEIDWFPGDECVFFHFAWGGGGNLTDGGFSVQMNNAIYAANSVRIAKQIGCVKFVNAGTLEESFVEQSLSSKGEEKYQSSQTDYALAKLAARDMCKMISYMEKIDYVHTRLSVPLASDLSQGSYVAKTLKLISDGKTFTPPKNNQLFDIVNISDVVRAFHLIGMHGKNKADYFIGTSRPETLANYFKIFTQSLKGIDKNFQTPINKSENSFFSTDEIFQDTGFVVENQFEDICKFFKEI